MTIALMMGFAMSANAQDVVTEDGKFFDNMYMGVGAGVQKNMMDFNCDFLTNRFFPVANLYIGKWVTPVLAIEVNGDVMFHDSFTSKNRVVDGHYLGINGLVNLNNLFCGYTGEPDLFEVSTITGLGWLRAYGDPEGDNLRQRIDANGIGAKVGLNLAFNLGESKAWQIVIRPTANYIIGTGKANDPGLRFDTNRGRANLEIGVTYKFPYENTKGEKTNNFTSVPVPYYSTYDLESVEPVEKIVEKEVVVEKTVEVPVEKVVEKTAYVVRPTFAQGSVTLDRSGKAALRILANEMKANDTKYVAIGYASEEGDESYNMSLSQRRAYAVKDYLIGLGVDASRITANGKGETTEFGTNYEDNRIVIVTQE